MKVLVATHESQGVREDDFDGCVEGELVWIQEPCALNRSGSGACGCGRAFAGIASHRGTTTATIRDLPGLTMASYTEALRGSFVDQGWPSEWAAGVAMELLEACSPWEPGAVLERRLDFVGLRFDPRTGRLRERAPFTFGPWTIS